jgi:hypothetical protein
MIPWRGLLGTARRIDGVGTVAGDQVVRPTVEVPSIARRPLSRHVQAEQQGEPCGDATCV